MWCDKIVGQRELLSHAIILEVYLRILFCERFTLSVCSTASRAQRSNNFASAVLYLHSMKVVMVVVLRRSVFEV